MNSSRQPVVVQSHKTRVSNVLPCAASVQPLSARKPRVRRPGHRRELGKDFISQALPENTTHPKLLLKRSLGRTGHPSVAVLPSRLHFQRELAPVPVCQAQLPPCLCPTPPRSEPSSTPRPTDGCSAGDSLCSTLPKEQSQLLHTI